MSKQRRARQRAERKARKQSRPVPAATPPKVPMHLETDHDVCNPGAPRPAEDYFYDVVVTARDEDEDPEEACAWIAEGGLRNDGMGVQFEATDSLAELVADVVDEVTEWRTRFPGLPIVWWLSRFDEGDSVEAMAELAAKEGITLPT